MKRSLAVFGAVVLVSVAMVGSAFAQISPQLPAPGAAPAGSPVAKHGKLKTSGKNIVGEDNNPVVLRGMSMYWAGLNLEQGNPYYNDAVVAWLAYDWKASVVRAAIPATKNDHMEDPNAAYRGATYGYADGDSLMMINKAKAVVEACIRRGMYVIVDWHTHNRPVNSSPGDSKYAAKGAEFMGTMAKLYGQYPNVLFEPFNEPVAGASTDEIKNYVNPMITEIRKYSENIIVVGSPNFSIKPADIMNTITGTNIAYSFHFYAHSHTKSNYSGNVNAVLTANKAVLVTEFGTTDYSGASNHNEANSNEWITYLEGEKIGWVNWSIYDGSEASMILASNTGGTAGGPWTLKPAGTWVKGQILGKNGPTGANYYPNSTFTVTSSVTPSEGGSIAVSPAGPYAYKAAFSATATPNEGWELKRWTGDAYGTDAKVEGNIVGIDLKIGASFYNGGLIKNGHFTSGILNWSKYNNGLTDPGASASISHADTTLEVTVSSPGVVAADISVYQNGLKLNQGRRYELSFEAKAASARNITVRVSNGRAATSAAYLKFDEALTTSMKKVTGKAFNMTSASVTDGYLVFDVGGTKSNVFITNVKLADIGESDPTGVARGAFSKPAVTSWSVSNIGGAARLNGPEGAGATLCIYDTRGKMVKSAAAVNGLTLGAGLSAGNYLLVVKNSSGAEVLRSKVVNTR